MGFAFCNCNKDNQNMQLPFTNLSLLDNKHNNDTKHNHIKNCDDLNQQSNDINNINDTRKNININIININKDQIMNSKKYSSNNNMSSGINRSFKLSQGGRNSQRRIRFKRRWRRRRGN